MIAKRYSLPSEQIAKDLILQLVGEDNDLEFNRITVTDTTHGIVCLGFQHKYDEEGELVEESLTYDVDVAWKELNENWLEYEVNPDTPNHKFSE